jgi:hypothetical protein
MPAIPSELNQRLHDTLVRCRALESDRSLHALFVDERLAPWRNDIPAAATVADRVAWLIDTLHDWTAANGDNALILFLCVLAETTNPGDALHDKLRRLTIELLEGWRKACEAELERLRAKIEELEASSAKCKAEKQRLEEKIVRLRAEIEKLEASLKECEDEKQQLTRKVRPIAGIAVALAAAMILGLVAGWILWPKVQPGAPVLTGLHYEVDGYNPRLVDLRTVSTDGIPTAEGHTLRLFDFTALLPEEDADFAVRVEVYANEERIGSGEVQREGQVAQLQTLHIDKYPGGSDQDAWQVQLEWETLDVVLVLSRDGKPVNKTHTPIRLNPNGSSWFIDPPNVNFAAVVYAINDGTPTSFDLRTDAGDELGVRPGDKVTFPEIWYRANAAADTKMFVEMHYLKDGNVIPGTYQVCSISKIEDGINLFAASSPLSSTVPANADTLLLLLVREEMVLDRLTLPLHLGGISVCRTEFRCAFGTAGNSETCTDTISIDSSRLVSRIYISMTERADGNNFGYSLWEVRAFKGADNVATRGTVRVSSSEGLAFNGCRDATCAIDGNMATRWGSAHGGAPQWFEITLATPALIDKIELVWQTAYAKAYCVLIE